MKKLDAQKLFYDITYVCYSQKGLKGFYTFYKEKAEIIRDILTFRKL